ncbi:MAG TPA: calcium-binding protein [Solirubrobacteraceae bacterium]|jgi:hypothetical protein
MKPRPAVLLTVLASLLLAPSASAETQVKLDYTPFEGAPPFMSVRSGDEDNVLSLSDDGVHDEASIVVAEAPCENVDEHTARCPDDEVHVIDVHLGGGDDTLTSSQDRHIAMFTGGAGDDEITASGSRTNWFWTGPGADVMQGGTGTDIAAYAFESSGDGVAVSFNGLADDGVPGEGDTVGAGFDVVLGSAGDDVLDLGATGPSGAVLRAFGGGGDDVLLGGAGPQMLNGGTGDDRYDGGAGDDVLTEALPRDLGEMCPGDPLYFVCPLTDESPGTSDVLAGGDGDDELLGWLGDDQLDGGPGDDVTSGGAGADDVHGGEGLDTAPNDDQRTDYSPGSKPSPALPVTITLDDQPNDGAESDRHADNLHTDIEEVQGTQKSDTLTGGPGADLLRGGNGDDVLTGLGGRDELVGDAGDDRHQARDGEADAIYCGPGDDAVEADAVDVAEATCERREDPAPAPPTEAGPPSGSSPPGTSPIAPPITGTFPPPADTLRPQLTVKAAKGIRRTTLLRRGLKLTVATSEPATISVALRRGGRRLARKRVKVSDGRRRVRLRIPRARRGKVAGRRLRLVIRATDAAGNVTTTRRVLRLR